MALRWWWSKLVAASKSISPPGLTARHAVAGGSVRAAKDSVGPGSPATRLTGRSLGRRVLQPGLVTGRCPAGCGSTSFP